MQNGQDVRVVTEAGRVVKFKVAEVLFDDDDKQARVGQGRFEKDATRWSEVLVVRTEAGGIAIRWATRTRWQGENDSEEWFTFPDEGEAAVALAARAGEDRLSREALRECGWWDRVAFAV